MIAGRRWRLVAVMLFAAGLLASAPAHAQPTSEDRAAAEALFIEGRQLAENSEFAPACDRFEKSQKLDPQIGTLLYLATCHEQLRLTASAWVEFKEALSQAESAKKADRVQQALDGVTRVEAILSKVTIVADASAPDQHIRVNGRDVTVFNVALPYNPGTLTVEAEAPGRKKHTQSVELPPGPVSLTITIPKLEEDALPPPPPPPPPKERDHTLAFIVGGSGLGVAALGFAFGGAAWATANAADEDHCEGTFCDQDGLDAHDRADAFAWTSNVLITAGALGAGAGVVLFFLWPPEDSDVPEKKAAGRPLLQVGSGSFQLGWTGSLP